MAHRVVADDYKGVKEARLAAEEAAKAPQPFKLNIEIEVNPTDWTDEEEMVAALDEFEAECCNFGNVKTFERSDA